jgi:ABC transport system ATP-binding/permease protein
LLNLIEAPALGFILSYIIRYIEDPNSNTYIFRVNENIHIYIFMSLIVALFLGLILSGEEIFRDRKILKREKFLNLSRSSYLLSKIFILFVISAIQTFLFVILANNILGIRGMTFTYWLALFSTAAFANMLGLNVSSTFNSAVTIYILIPLLMIPMMILSGAMFSFDKLNRTVGRVDKVPFIAELMVTKWGYEALMVHQFKDNDFTKKFYELEKQESQADFKKVYHIPELQDRLSRIDKELKSNKLVDFTKDDLILIINEIKRENKHAKLIETENSKTYQLTGEAQIPPVYYDDPNELNIRQFNLNTVRHIYEYLKRLDTYYGKVFQTANRKRQNMITYYLENKPELYQEFRDRYFNESISDILKKVYEKNKILEYRNHLVQHIDPIYEDPIPDKIYNIRSHFFAPRKHFFGHYYDTFWFNMIVIWLLTSSLYILLYYDAFKKLLTFGERLKRK